MNLYRLIVLRELEFRSQLATVTFPGHEGAGQSDLVDRAVQVGKMLNDPVRGFEPLEDVAA